MTLLTNAHLNLRDTLHKLSVRTLQLSSSVPSNGTKARVKVPGPVWCGGRRPGGALRHRTLCAGDAKAVATSDILFS